MTAITRFDLEAIAARVLALGVCGYAPGVTFGISDDGVRALVDVGAKLHTSVHRAADREPYAIDGASLTIDGCEFRAQSPGRPATAEEIAALGGATASDTVSATVPR